MMFFAKAAVLASSLASFAVAQTDLPSGCVADIPYRLVSRFEPQYSPCTATYYSRETVTGTVTEITTIYGGVTTTLPATTETDVQFTTLTLNVGTTGTTVVTQIVDQTTEETTVVPLTSTIQQTTVINGVTTIAQTVVVSGSTTVGGVATSVVATTTVPSTASVTLLVRMIHTAGERLQNLS